MSQSKPQSANSISLAIMRWPVLWGALATIGFYIAIRAGHIQHPLVTRYFASHPVEYIATTMFFVGLAALAIRLIELALQKTVSGDSILGPIPDNGQPIEDCPHLLEQIDQQPAGIRNGKLAGRLRDAVEYVRRTRSAEGLEEQLRTLAENEEAKSHNSYALVRIVISTIPILGFLGTVIGITRAVAELAQLVGDISFEEAINSVVSGLSVAFDTTALALALSIVLMFAMFFINRSETRLLAELETDASFAMIGRFRSVDDSHAPHVTAVRQMSEEVVRSTEGLVERQAELWRDTVEAANHRWTSTATTTEKQLETALTRALHSSLQKHADHLQAAEAAADARNRQTGEELLDVMNRSAAASTDQQRELGKQTQLLTKTIDATERVLKLEDALNRNLQSLHQTQHFDQAISSLTAAVSLLNSKLGQVPNKSQSVRLPRPKKPGNAA